MTGEYTSHLHSAADIGAWRLPLARDKSAFEASLVERTRDTAMWRNDGVIGPRLSPVDFYCWLQSRFGPPAGPFMRFRSNDTDNLIHWNYLLASDHGDILNARTGWPTPLCERFIGLRTARTITILQIAILALMVAAGVCRLMVLRFEQAGFSNPPQVWITVGTGFMVALYVLVVLWAALGAGRVWTARRNLPRFLAAPWCLNCRYPIDPAQRLLSRCPECGEPIPPEIARLAAEQKAGSA